MTFLLKQIFSLFKLLNSDKGGNQIAAGIACGLILGFAPAFSLQTVLVIIVLFFFRIQIGAALIAAFFFKFAAWLLDPVSNEVGKSVLELESLRPLFTELYSMPIVPFTRFYNSLVMGSGIIALVLAIPVFFVSRSLVNKYRETVVARFGQSKFWKAWRATSFYNWYATYDKMF